MWTPFQEILNLKFRDFLLLFFKNKNPKPEVHTHAHTVHAFMHAPTHTMGACEVLNLGMEILYQLF